MSRIHDLTLTYSEDMPGVSFDQAKDLGKDGWNAKTLHLYSHAGTHMDAPIHFGVDGPTIDKMPVQDFLVESWIVDISDIEPGGLISIEHLGDVQHDFKSREGIVLKSGWSSKIGSPEYRNKLPRVSEELAHWLVEKEVKLLGVEPPSVADVNNIEEVTKIHEILLGGRVIIVEGLTNLESITAKKVTLVALPLKIKGGDGAPARVIAIED
ncbi:MAG: cyclase family protein [Cyclobacteriaceae bacterium]